ncbi:MAG: DNA replication complex GINS family protein [Nitrososphaerota archaeon]|nr:DNA replication complex GINS family protein [Nitrososphaerota archaeon]
MRDESRDARTVLDERERDFLLAKARVTMKSSLENIDLGDYKLDGVKEGESVELPRWVAEELVRMNLADAPEEPFEMEIVKALSREKMMGPLQLSPLPGDFYVRMRRRLAYLEAAAKEGKVRREDHERVRASSYDLIGMRLSKLLALSSTSATAASLADKLSPEERAFFSTSQSFSREWKEAMLGGAT